MSSTNRPDKQLSENRMKEGSSKSSSPSSPNSRQGRGRESSGSQSPKSPSKPESSQLRQTKDRTSGDDGRQNKNSSFSPSKPFGKRTPQTKDINIPVAQSFRGDQKEGSGSSGATSAGSRSTGKYSGSENPVSDRGSTRPTTPTRSRRDSQVYSPGRASVGGSAGSTPDTVIRDMSRPLSEGRTGLSSNATEKSPIIYSANKLELSANKLELSAKKLEPSAIKNLNIYKIRFFPYTPPREQCRAFIRGLHKDANLRCLSEGYASDYASNLLTVEAIQDAAKNPLILPMPADKDHDGKTKLPRCHLLVLRISSIPAKTVLDYILARPDVSLPSPLESNLQALSILIPRSYQDSIYTHGSKNGSKFYASSESPQVLKKQGLELTRGYAMDVLTRREQLNLRARSCTAVYYPEMSLSQLIETFGITKYNAQGIEILEKLLVGLKVCITYDKARKDKVKTIKSIGDLPRNIKFVNQDGNGSTDVKAHFENRWSRKIEKPGLPAVNLGSKKTDLSDTSASGNAQGSGKTNKITAVWVPPEFCIVIPNQLRRGVLSLEQAQSIAAFARTNVPKVDINQTVRDGFNRHGGPAKLPGSRVFDLQNRQNQIAICKRIRQSSKFYEDSNGNAGNAPSMKGTSGSVIHNAPVVRKNDRDWSILRFNSGESAVESIESKAIELFQQALKDRGWNMEPTRKLTAANPSQVAMTETLRQAKNSGVKILLVVLPDRKTTKPENRVRSSGQSTSNGSTQNLSQRSDHPNAGLDPVDYATLKRIANTEVGIHTVCLNITNLVKCVNHQHTLDEEKTRRNCANIALKFNLKCGGSNRIIAIRDNSLEKSNIMVVGIHITPRIDPIPTKPNKLSKKNQNRAKRGRSPTRPPPPPKCKRNAPRIVGMIANSNHTLGQWPGSLRSQASNIDTPQDLGAMIAERLEKWQAENNRSLPENILVYRSGASEGQYESIIDEELKCIKSACAKIYAKTRSSPKLTMIAVTKLHNSGFAAIEDDSEHGTFVANDLAIAEDFALHASIPVLQNDKQANSKTRRTNIGAPNTGRLEKAAPTHTKPAHYVVLHDDMKLKINDLETITHDLCYAVGTTTQAVSVCAPIHYARLLCDHAKSYDYETYNQDWVPSNSNRAVFKGDPETLGNIYDGIELKNTMFYV